MSSPEPDLSETSRILLRKAAEDATAVREFAGKAVTAASGVRHSAIHDIDRLIEIVEAAGIEVPLDRDRLAVLTQYAVPFRYDELLDAESLEREVLVALVDEVATGVSDQIGAGGG